MSVALAIFTLGMVAIIFSGMLNSPALLAIGIICLALMPYFFRIVKSLRILEIAGSGSKKQKLIMHKMMYANDMVIPDEIELSQVVSITPGIVFGDLMEFTFIENGEKQKIISFIKKGKLNHILNLTNQLIG